MKLIKKLLFGGAAAGISLAKKKVGNAKKQAKKRAKRAKISLLFTLLVFVAGEAAGGVFVLKHNKA